MSRKRLPWIMVGVCSLAFVTQAVGQEVPQGLDQALSGQAAKRMEPKRETPPLVLSPVFWSPSPNASEFIKELRQTKTKDFPSADTPYREADPWAPTFRSKNPPLSPERTTVYVALSDPAPGTSLDQRCIEIGAEIEAERLRIEKNGTPRGKEAVTAAASVNVWARHEGARLARMLDPKSDVYQERLLGMQRRRGPGETDEEIEERLREQIRSEHLEQLLGTSAIEAEVYRQRLPKLLAEKRPEETREEIEKRLRKEVGDEHVGRHSVGGKEIAIERYAEDFWPHRTKSDRDARFKQVCKDLLYDRSIWRAGRDRLIHYIMARDPRLSYQEARLLYAAGIARILARRFTKMRWSWCGRSEALIF